MKDNSRADFIGRDLKQEVTLAGERGSDNDKLKNAERGVRVGGEER